MIVINGAGIAGLTLANALQRHNLDYVLIEKAHNLEAIGAGIILQNNGLAILQYLDLLQYIGGFNVNKANIANFKDINTINANELGVKCKVVHRAELQRVLLKNIDSARIKRASSIQSYEIEGEIKSEINYELNSNQKNVTVTLSDQSIIKCDYLIDASGIQSDLLDQPELYDSQMWCWRCIVNLKQPIDASGEYWFGKQRLGLAPISNTQAYLYHVIKLSNSQTAHSFSDEARQQWILSKAEQVEGLNQIDFSNAQSSITWLSHPLKDRKINWGEGHIIKIGDSAHAMTPNLGQGAVLSMEDAVVLADLISNNPEKVVADDLKQLRHKRIKATHKMSRQVGWFAHNEQIMFKIIKFFMFKFMPLKLSINKQKKWMDQFINQLKLMN